MVDEGARALVDLRRCAQAPGCEDWRNCSLTVGNTWRAAGETELPDAASRAADASKR